MDGLLLTILGAGPVVPRRVRVELLPGTGRLRLPPRTDAVWQRSVAQAWDAAQQLANRRDADAHVEVVGSGPLQGASSGLPIGLLCLAALLDAPLPEHAASGGVEARGFLSGGRAAPAKARAVAQLAPQLGWKDPVFVCPPLQPAPSEAGLRVALAADLGSAWSRLVPEAYPRIAAAHRNLRAGGGEGRFATVHRPPGPPLPDRIEGIAVREVPATDGQTHVELGEAGLVLWRAQLPPGLPRAEDLPHLWALADAAAVR